MNRFVLHLVLAVLLAAGALSAGCAHATRALPGTPCCGASCESTCWPRGRIGPVCPGLCRDCEERTCPTCPPGTYPAYRGPVLGKMSS